MLYVLIYKKMAPTSILRICAKCAENLALLRCTKSVRFSSSTYATTTTPKTEEDEGAPVKFSNTKASKLSIDEMFGFKQKKDEMWIQPYVAASCLTIILLYFCVFREENDMDDILRGTVTETNEYVEYLDLVMKLEYSKRNNLPTAALQDKVNKCKAKLNIE